MKIQTIATIERISIDGESTNRIDKSIDLEFSAIDTGGGFKDPILDFSFTIEDSDLLELIEEYQEMRIMLVDPQEEENEASFSYRLEGSISGKQINGRLKEDQLSRTLIGFVLQLLR